MRRTAILFIAGARAGYALIHLVYYVILDVKRENPLHSVFVFDLGGITHFSGENQFPVDMERGEDRAPDHPLLQSRIAGTATGRSSLAAS